jgi:hypothetical protein
MNQPPDYLLRLRPLPGWPLPPWQRLRGLVKVCLRTFGFRVVALREQPRNERP